MPSRNSVQMKRVLHKLKKLKELNKLKALWRGECPYCRVPLVDVKGWDRSDCPKCGRHFKDR